MTLEILSSFFISFNIRNYDTHTQFSNYLYSLSIFIYCEKIILENCNFFIFLIIFFKENIVLYIISTFCFCSLLYYVAFSHINLRSSVMAFFRMKYSVKCEWMHIDINGLMDEEFYSILQYAKLEST